jgi:hypothetical protein
MTRQGRTRQGRTMQGRAGGQISMARLPLCCQRTVRSLCRRRPAAAARPGARPAAELRVTSSESVASYALDAMYCSMYSIVFTVDIRLYIVAVVSCVLVLEFTNAGV